MISAAGDGSLVDVLYAALRDAGITVDDPADLDDVEDAA